MGGRKGRVDVAAAGRVMFSTVSEPPFAMSSRPDGRPACFLSFINEAGVAGSLVIGNKGADCDPCCCAARYGDFPAEADRGVAGGGIRASDNGSGDIDSASELSWMYKPPCWKFLLALFFELCASWMISATSFAGMTVLLRLACGFIAGDWRTVRVGFRN